MNAYCVEDGSQIETGLSLRNSLCILCTDNVVCEEPGPPESIISFLIANTGKFPEGIFIDFDEASEYLDYSLVDLRVRLGEILDSEVGSIGFFRTTDQDRTSWNIVVGSRSNDICDGDSLGPEEYSVIRQYGEQFHLRKLDQNGCLQGHELSAQIFDQNIRDQMIAVIQECLNVSPNLLRCVLTPLRRLDIYGLESRWIFDECKPFEYDIQYTCRVARLCELTSTEYPLDFQELDESDVNNINTLRRFIDSRNSRIIESSLLDPSFLIWLRRLYLTAEGLISDGGIDSEYEDTLSLILHVHNEIMEYVIMNMTGIHVERPLSDKIRAELAW